MAKRIPYLNFFFFGLLLPLGFAPFHIPGLAILSLAFFYHYLSSKKYNSPFFAGLAFGLGFFGLGVSWVYVSIHEFGHLNSIFSAFITLLFLLYISLFPALGALAFSRLNLKPFSVFSGLAFSALWILSEFLRANFLTGFPWLLIGFGQFDTPLRFLFPVIGVLGVGFITCFATSLLCNSMRLNGFRKYPQLVAFFGLLLLPSLFNNVKWGEESTQALTVGVIQANLSMRDKWDETLFWQLLQGYQDSAEKLLGTELIVMPESAIPLPATYIHDYLNNLHQSARKSGSAILLGIPQPTGLNENTFHNGLMSLGRAKGSYLKQHLVPFGEYTPPFFRYFMEKLGVEDANLQPGRSNQNLVRVHRHPIASLICYELAYGNLLRSQLPAAQWIVSISDVGWFGHSLALYQQLQMAQVLSLETARYQVVANNDGLSSIINAQGEIIASLPAFMPGILRSSLHPATGETPWVKVGDWPVLILSLVILFISLLKKVILMKENPQTLAARHKRRYPYQLD